MRTTHHAGMHSSARGMIWKASNRLWLEDRTQLRLSLPLHMQKSTESNSSTLAGALREVLVELSFAVDHAFLLTLGHIQNVGRTPPFAEALTLDRKGAVCKVSINFYKVLLQASDVVRVTLSPCHQQQANISMLAVINRLLPLASI